MGVFFLFSFLLLPRLFPAPLGSLVIPLCSEGLTPISCALKGNLFLFLKCQIPLCPPRESICVTSWDSGPVPQEGEEPREAGASNWTQGQGQFLGSRSQKCLQRSPPAAFHQCHCHGVTFPWHPKSGITEQSCSPPRSVRPLCHGEPHPVSPREQEQPRGTGSSVT